MAEKKKNESLRDRFVDVAKHTANAVGSVWAFATAFAVVLIWIISGPFFGYSDTWQLVINTGTTIITFLMVFLIQSTQNRDSKALHLKLDELIRAQKGARDSMVDLEDLGEEELERLGHEFKALRQQTGGVLKARKEQKKFDEKVEDCADAEVGGTVPQEEEKERD